jgi:predicted nuclease of restriction endonuclease-like RecB superfamily
MLTREHAIAEYENRRIVPDRLKHGPHRHYVAYAARLLEIYAGGVGRTRRELHRDVERTFDNEPNCPPQRIAAFCKLLDDAGDFDTDRFAAAASLRLKVFTLAAEKHPLVAAKQALFENEEQAVKAEIAAALKTPWAEIERRLYADVLDNNPLRAFAGYETPEALLARYNVAQTQVCLYGAASLTIDVTSDFQFVLQHVKLARLLHEITRLGPSAFRIELTGPASILRETRRYGVAMAHFLPALLACKGKWSLRAPIRTKRGTVLLALDNACGLTSHIPAPAEFDSSLEENFAAAFGPERDGWSLAREGEILDLGQKTFVPDFVFRRRDGREVFLEIVGFWTPEYLAAKLETLRRFADRRILVAAAARRKTDFAALPGPVIFFKNSLRVADVLAALESEETLDK